VSGVGTSTSIQSRTLQVYYNFFLKAEKTLQIKPQFEIQKKKQVEIRWHYNLLVILENNGFVKNLKTEDGIKQKKIKLEYKSTS
jgi:hypothetical protein